MYPITINDLFVDSDYSVSTTLDLPTIQKLAILIDGYHNFGKRSLLKEIKGIVPEFDGGISVTYTDECDNEITIVGNYHTNTTITKEN
jgi:hypothetical protein